MPTSEIPDAAVLELDPARYDPDADSPENGSDLSPYDAGRLLVRGETGPDQIEALNAFIDTTAGHSGRLEQPVGDAARWRIVPVTGVDAKVLRDTIRGARRDGGARLPAVEVELIHRHSRSTLKLAGDKWGHSFEFFPTVPVNEVPTFPAPVEPPVGRRPVIALLDSGVREHPRLPADFVLERWEPTPALGPPDLSDPKAKMASGHATFIAGLIQMQAPAAQVLSMRVMGDDGRVDEADVVQALEQVRTYVGQGRTIDAVCMPFGRQVRPADDIQLMLEIKALLQDLAVRRVRLAASAGNEGSGDKTYPAAFADDFPLESVGSLDPDGAPAPYSNHGDWVKQWRVGTRVVSIMPDAGFARWSGTSFALGRFAGELAKGTV